MLNLYAIIFFMKIITTPDPRLRQKSKKVSEITKEVQQIIANMRKLSLDWEKKHPYEISAAMAAPQIGKNYRIIIIRDNMEDKAQTNFIALINPEIIKTNQETKTDYEGCLSVPKIYGLVSRPTKVKIKAKLENGNEIRLKAEGELARILLHEIDHLNGVLFIDHIKNQTDAFFSLDEQGELKPVDYEKNIKNNQHLFPHEN